MGFKDWIKSIFLSSETEESIWTSQVERDFPSIFPKRSIITYSKKHHSKCQFQVCTKKINSFTRYECNYCHKEFCENHRLPEEHGCKNPKLPLYMKRSMGRKVSREIPDRRSREAQPN